MLPCFLLVYLWSIAQAQFFLPDYLNWVRSPTPLNIYPRIFSKLTNYKRGATSHSTSWGKRSGEDFIEEEPNEDYIEDITVDKRTSSTGLRKLFSIGTSPYKDPNEDSPLVKRAWLPELDEEEVETPEEKKLDDVYSFNLKKEMDAIRYYFMMGTFYGGPYITNTNGRDITDDTINYIIEMRKKHHKDRYKRRMGMIQRNPLRPDLPEREECRYLDRLSQRLCNFLLNSGKGLRFKKTCENNRCYGVGSKRELDLNGGMESLIPSMNEGTGKKYRKM